MPRFIYHAHALALGGFLRKPVQQHLEAVCSCVLPSVGGRTVSRAGPFQLTHPATGGPLIAFDSAESSLEGAEGAPGQRRTELRTAVRGLRVLDVLRVDEIIAVLTVTYRGDNAVLLDTEGSRFQGLSLGGKALEIKWDHALGRDASDYAAFRRKYPQLPERRGITRHSLAVHPALKFEPWEAGYLDQPNFGRVYFSEWWAAPYRQGLVMLRLRLGSPAEGEIEVGALEADGHDYP